MQYRVSIEYQTPARKRLRPLVKVLSHWGLSGLFLGLGLLFLVKETVPLGRQWIQARRQIEQQKQELVRWQQEIASLRLSGPFTQRWRPNLFVEFSRLCPDSVAVYNRIARVQQSTPVRLRGVHVVENERGPGFRFSLEATGSYGSLTDFLKKMELSFQFFRIDRLTLEPQFAEQKYEGQLHVTCNGWIW